jgi:hypothetical protein
MASAEDQRPNIYRGYFIRTPFMIMGKDNARRLRLDLPGRDQMIGTRLDEGTTLPGSSH